MARLLQIREPSSDPSDSSDTENEGQEDSSNQSVASTTPPTSTGTAHGNEDEPIKSESSRRRSGRARASVVYDESELAGTAKFGRRGDRRLVSEPATRNVSGATLVNDMEDSDGSMDGPTKQILQENVKALNKDLDEALNLDWEVLKKRPVANGESSQINRRKSVRVQFSLAASNVKEAASTLGKRGRDAYENAKESVREALPHRHTEEATKSPPKKSNSLFPNLKRPLSEKEKLQEKARAALEEQWRRDPRNKTKLEEGLYVGTRRDFNPTQHGEGKGKSRKSLMEDDFSELDDCWLPLPMGRGRRLFEEGRDFKLPFDILNPLPNDEAPKDWRRLDKNRFIGDAFPHWRAEYKKRSDDDAYCTCTRGKGCHNPDELDQCDNGGMLYECTAKNCRLTEAGYPCLNRPFAELQERREAKNAFRPKEPAEKPGPNMYSEGVEVFKTQDRGHGVRAMRSFEPNQVIVEYNGEVVTLDESDRRTNEVYKGKNNYYFMYFHDGLIIDATRGSICRFVNHSCEPNCRVEKYLVDGEPRMALFALDNGIGVGEELTYDYNFELNNKEAAQPCYCGTPSCRGKIGPQQKQDGKIAKAANAAKNAVVNTVRGVKRGLSRVLGPDDDDNDTKQSPQKKRKTDPRAMLSRMGRHLTGAYDMSDPDLSMPVQVVDLAAQNKSRGERAARRATLGVAPTLDPGSPLKVEGKLKRHSEFSMPLTAMTQDSPLSSITGSPEKPTDLTPRRTNRNVKNKFVRTSAERSRDVSNASLSSTSTVGSTIQKVGNTLNAAKSLPSPSPTKATNSSEPSPKRTKSVLASSLSAVLDIASRLDEKKSPRNKLIKKAFASPSKTGRPHLGSASRPSASTALLAKSKKTLGISSLKQSRISFGKTGGMGLRARSRSSTASPLKNNNKKSPVKIPARSNSKLTKSPRKTYGTTRLESQSPQPRKSGSLVRENKENKRPGTSARPMTAMSVASSMREGVVRSVKGPARAAAVMRMGLRGDEALRKTIRQVSGAEG